MMSFFVILSILVYVVPTAAIVFLFYYMYRISIEQKKTTLILKKIYEQKGGEFTPEETEQLRK